MVEIPALDMKSGQWGEVTTVEGNSFICRRLMEIGFTPGECIRRITHAPFGYPVVYNLRGTIYALRKDEAECIKVWNVK